MSVAVVATTIGHWETAQRMIDSILDNEPHVTVVMVGDRSMPGKYREAEMVRPKAKLNCQQAQNIGIQQIDADWYVVCDADVICKGSFANDIEVLHPDFVHGPKVNRGGRNDMPYDYLDGWFYAFHANFFKDVGLFDESFEASGFEDADICYRGYKMGYGIARLSVPFDHKAMGLKRDITGGYNDARARNVERVKQKHGTYGDKERGELDWGPPGTAFQVSGSTG
jgi:hypothetical protein